MFGGRISKLGSSFSLALLLAGSALAQGPYSSLDDRLEGVTDPAAVERLASEAAIRDSQLNGFIHGLSARNRSATQRLKDYVRLKAQVERSAKAGDQNPKELATRIKSNPVYRDRGPGESSNWLAVALEKLSNLFKWNAPDTPDFRPPRQTFWTGQGLTMIAWGLIFAGVLAFAYFAFRHFSWKAKLKRRATALLGEDEPERSLDEWLNMADALEKEGKYREAVRCLYLACLIKFDEYHVARFERGETNWEHLTRIEASPRRPAHLSFREPTQYFDRVWYGHHVKGVEDVQVFRSWYSQIVDSLRGVAA